MNVWSVVILNGIIVWRWVIERNGSYLDLNVYVYQLTELMIEEKTKKTHDSYTCNFGIVSHENQHFYLTILNAWLLSLVKFNGPLLLEIVPSFHERWVFEGHFDFKVWVTPLNSNFSSTQNQLYNTYFRRMSIKVLKTLS